MYWQWGKLRDSRVVRLLLVIQQHWEAPTQLMTFCLLLHGTWKQTRYWILL